MKENTQPVFYLKLGDLRLDEGFNTRYAYGDMPALKASILDRGIQDAIIVRPDPEKEGSYIVGSQGHRRVRAVSELVADNKLKKADVKIPARLEEANLSDEQRTLDILTLNTGKPLEMLEEAQVYQNVLTMTLGSEEDQAEHDPKAVNKVRSAKIKEMAAKAGKSETHVRNCLKLLTAPARVLQHVKMGRISPTLVVETLVKKDDPEAVTHTIQCIVDKAQESGKDRGSKKDAPKEKSRPTDDEADAKAFRAAENYETKLRQHMQAWDDKSMKAIARVINKVTSYMLGGSGFTLNDIRAEAKDAAEAIQKEGAKSAK